MSVASSSDMSCNRVLRSSMEHGVGLVLVSITQVSRWNEFPPNQLECLDHVPSHSTMHRDILHCAYYVYRQTTNKLTRLKFKCSFYQGCVDTKDLKVGVVSTQDYLRRYNTASR
jgi:hypothetical protein